MKTQAAGLSRSRGGRSISRWVARLCLGGMMSAGVAACGDSTEVPVEALSQGLFPMTTVEQCYNFEPASMSAEIVVDCGSMVPVEPRRTCLYPEGVVTFSSRCATMSVTLYFRNPQELFTDGSAFVTLEPVGSPGSSVSKTVDAFASQGHALCWTAGCDEVSDKESKAGEIDVYTSGPSEEPEL
jgi:hypothetical protein